MVEQSLCDLLGSKTVACFIFILEHLCTHNELLWGWGSSLKGSFVFCILCNKYLLQLHFVCDLSHEIKRSIFHLWHHVNAQKGLSFGAVQTLDFEL